MNMDILFAFFLVLFLIVSLPSAFLAFAWFYLAPKELFATHIAEPTAKIVLRGKVPRKMMFRFKGHVQDAGWNIMPSKGAVQGDKFLGFDLGGFAFYGFSPFDKIFYHKENWTTIDENGDPEEHGMEEDGVTPKLRGYVYLGDSPYLLTLKGAEDSDSVPIDVKMIVTARIKNPYKAYFNISDWKSAVLTKMKAPMRAIMGEYSFQQMVKTPNLKANGDLEKELAGLTPQDLNQLDKVFFELLKKRGILQLFDDNYGIEVKEVQIEELIPPEWLKEKILAVFTAKMNAAAKLIEDRNKAKIINFMMKAYMKFGDAGLFWRYMESMEKSNLSMSASFGTNYLPGVLEKIQKAGVLPDLLLKKPDQGK
jgi:hypothetical protein